MTTLNYWMMVERCPNLKEEVGGSIPGCEISSLLDQKKLARRSIASCALALACGPSVSQRKKRKKIKKIKNWICGLPPPPSGRRSLRVLVDYHLWWIENVQNIIQIHKSVLWDI